MSVKYSKEARDYAKANKLALFAVEVDGRTSDDGTTGKYTSDGPLDSRMARALWFFCFYVTKGGSTPAKEFKKWFPNGRPLPLPKKKAKPQ